MTVIRHKHNTMILPYWKWQRVPHTLDLIERLEAAGFRRKEAYFVSQTGDEVVLVTLEAIDFAGALGLLT